MGRFGDWSWGRAWLGLGIGRGDHAGRVWGEVVRGSRDVVLRRKLRRSVDGSDEMRLM